MTSSVIWRDRENYRGAGPHPDRMVEETKIHAV